MIAVVIYATSPMIRLINLGIRLVDADVLEAADAFGSTGMLKLVLVQLPLSLPTVMAGVNQTMMMSLSIVVVGVGGWLTSRASSITGLSFPSTALPLARDDPA
jgi:glycine betaine/proline transport system permease protein